MNQLTYVIIGWIRVLFFAVISTIIIHVDLLSHQYVYDPVH